MQNLTAGLLGHGGSIPMRGWLLLLLLYARSASGDFKYPDFATVCDPELKCAPQFLGTLACCLPFSTDAESALYLNSGAHFQTCAQVRAESTGACA